jgi:hypothetical protein
VQSRGALGGIVIDPNPEEAEAKKPTIRGKALIRDPGFEGRRAGETHEFTKQRQKNRLRNKMAKASRKHK